MWALTGWCSLAPANSERARPLPASGLPGGLSVSLDSPLKGSPRTLPRERVCLRVSMLPEGQTPLVSQGCSSPRTGHRFLPGPWGGNKAARTVPTPPPCPRTVAPAPGLGRALLGSAGPQQESATGKEVNSGRTPLTRRSQSLPAAQASGGTALSHALSPAPGGLWPLLCREESRGPSFFCISKMEAGAKGYQGRCCSQTPQLVHRGVTQGSLGTTMS